MLDIGCNKRVDMLIVYQGHEYSIELTADLKFRFSSSTCMFFFRTTCMLLAQDGKREKEKEERRKKAHELTAHSRTDSALAPERDRRGPLPLAREPCFMPVGRHGPYAN